jgi:hypothetical protein
MVFNQFNLENRMELEKLMKKRLDLERARKTG